MKNVINWFEIPATDFNRAISLYKPILGLDITETKMFGTKMGCIPADEKKVPGAIVQEEDCKPSSGRAIAYLNGRNNLQIMLNKAEGNNGKIIVPKTQINPGMGYFGMFIDTEANKMAVHSIS